MEELTEFQTRCFRQLQELVADLGLELEFKSVESAQFEYREIDGGCEQFIHGRVAEKGLEFWIYEDAAMYSMDQRGRKFEPPDFDSEADLMKNFLENLASELGVEDGRESSTSTATGSKPSALLRRLLGRNREREDGK